VPVNITFNYLYYLEEQYEMIAKIIKDLISIGFYDFIVADLALLLYLKEKNIKCSIHLSGECAELNRLSIEFLNKFHISRYIFHRKNTIEDMEACINNNQVKNLQYEAFILNEKCHYTGAFCSSLHCDEMIHLCKMPYEIAKVSEQANSFEEVNKRIEQYYKEFEENEELSEENKYGVENECDAEGEEETGSSYVLGETGCGLCALKRLKMAGVTHLKVVGRGNSVDNMKRDVDNLRKAIDMLADIEDNNTYEISVKDKLFEGKCSGQCYY
jgi:collagenase-like PrtC family protease